MRVDPGHAPSRTGRGNGPSGGSGAPARSRPSGPPPAPAVDAAAVASLAEPVIRAAGMDLESVKIATAGRRRLLRIVVDADGGASLDDIAEVSRAISRGLDGSDVMGGTPYTLEVSTPGVERPLTEPRHWRRAKGRLVEVPLAAPAAGQHGGGAAKRAATVSGRVTAASETGVTLDVDGQQRRFSYAELGPGRVRVEFTHPGETGSSDTEGGSPDGY